MLADFIEWSSQDLYFSAL